MINTDAMLDPPSFRQVFSHYPAGVCVITAAGPSGEKVGFVVGTFNSVSLDPPLVGFFADRRSTSWAQIAQIGTFCVNILSDDQHDLCKKFASKGTDKFAGVSHRSSLRGAPVLDAVVAWCECSLEAVHEAGDHFIAVGRVTQLAIEMGEAPLLFHRGELVSIAFS
ncbi:flavin reductase family protein [Achromobacter sp. NPDC058515]|uniref:flavin reductase family protein n=1 Tax=Achromobacter sp. NPDC058515 TaxID=3346533 RepID=UPI00364CF972